MNVTQLALGNARVMVIAVVAIVILGIQTFLSYPSAEDPTITIRQATLTAHNRGMTAEQIESLVTKPIEIEMRGIAEIDEIKSTSKDGMTLIDVTIHDWVADLDPVFQDIRNKAADLASSLPDNTVGPIVNDDSGLVAIATIALWADGFSLAEMRTVADDVRDRLYTLDGIRKVQLYGIQEERIYLEFLPSRMAQLGVSPSAIFGQLEKQNIVAPGGAVHVGSRSIAIEPTGNLLSFDQIGSTLFEIPGTNQVARLDSIVDIRRGYIDPPSSPVFFNDKPAIVISVSTVEGTNNIDFGDRLTAMLADIESELMIGYVLDYATYQPDLIDTAVGDAMSNVYQTLAIVLVVVMMFLGLRTGLIVGSFVPLTMLLGLVTMSMFEIELQRMSIAAVIIALGLLVDNGIVVAEDIRVRMEGGATPFDAALGSGKSLALPLLSSTLTTVFAFVPMLLTEGGAGEYVGSLAQVVAILLLASWLLSMSVTPLMCAWFIRVRPRQADTKEQASDSVVHLAYSRALRVVIRFRYVFIAGLVALLVGAVALLGMLRTEFFPLGDRNQLLVFVDFEAGTDVRTVEDRLRVLTGWLADEAENPEIDSHVAYVASGGPRFFLAMSPVDPDPHRAFILVTTKQADQVHALVGRINQYVDSSMPEVRSDAKLMWFGSSEPGLVKIRLIGPDIDRLMAAAADIETALYDIPGTVGIKDDWENRVLKMIIEVDQARARRAGVTSEDIASALEVTYRGTSVTEFRDGDDRIPILVRGEPSLQSSLYAVGQVQVYNSTSGAFVTLAQVASIGAEWNVSRVRRLDQERTITVEARSEVMAAPDLVAALQPALDALDLPPSMRIEFAGEVADQAEANENLFGLLPLALAGIVLLLVAQFNSIRRAAIILATIPLILIGAVLGLAIMNAPFGFMVLLGFFSLAGIVINNGIVLIDRIETERSDGRALADAVEAACLARLRPILMTTLTTVLGLVPLILFGGALFYGMASAIAFGLVVATLLTLGFVPAVYLILMRPRRSIIAGRVSEKVAIVDATTPRRGGGSGGSDRQDSRWAGMRGLHSSLGWLATGWWIDRPALAGVLRILFPLSRIWAAADLAEGDVDRLADEIAMPIRGLLRARAQSALEVTDSRRTAAHLATAERDLAFWSIDAQDSEHLRVLEQTRMRACNRYMNARAAFWPLRTFGRPPPIRLQIATPDETYAVVGDATRDPISWFAPEESVEISRSHPLVAKPDRVEYWLRLRSLVMDDVFTVRVREPVGISDPPTVIYGSGVGMETDQWSDPLDDYAAFLGRGMRVIELCAPWHGARRPPGWWSGEPFFGTAPLGPITLFRAQAIEIAALTGWARETSGGPVALAGVSLGALAAQAAASNSAAWPSKLRADVMVLLTTADRLDRLTFDSALARGLGMDKALVQAGWTPEMLLQLRPLTDPLVPPAMGGKKCDHGSRDRRFSNAICKWQTDRGAMGRAAGEFVHWQTRSFQHADQRSARSASA